MKVAKKLHVEITPANWKSLREYVRLYNDDEHRVTSRVKPGDIINESLFEFLKKKKTQTGGGT